MPSPRPTEGHFSAKKKISFSLSSINLNQGNSNLIRVQAAGNAVLVDTATMVILASIARVSFGSF
jgi:hypothetical protein